MKPLQILTSSGSIFSIIAIKWIIGSQYNFITGEKYCYFTSLKWFLELLQSHFAYILSVNISEIHKNRPVSQNTWNTVYVQPETFYVLQYVLFILQRVLIVPYTTHIGNTELLPLHLLQCHLPMTLCQVFSSLSMSFRPDMVYLQSYSKTFGRSAQSYTERCYLHQLYLAQIIFPVVTTNSCFWGRQSRNSIHSLSLPSHSPPARLIGDITATRNLPSLMSGPLQRG